MDSTAKLIGTFKAFVYKNAKTKSAKQNGVAVFYVNDEDLIAGYFYVKEGVKPLAIHGVADKENNEVEFRVTGTEGTYYAKLKDLYTKNKIYLNLEKENKKGEMKTSEVGYLTRVEDYEE